MKSLRIFLFAFLCSSIGSTDPAPPSSSTYEVLAEMPVHWRDNIDNEKFCPPDHTKPTAVAIDKCGIRETPEARAVRLRGMAASIDSAFKEKWKRALLMSVLWKESGNAFVVTKCILRGDGGRALGGYQSHTFKHLPHAECPSFQDQTLEAARHLTRTLNFCGRPNDSLETLVYSSVSLYATGGTCSWKGARERVKAWKWIMARL